jgi:hypothetical protein
VSACYGQPTTDGRHGACFFYFFRNNHPLVFLCLADPRNPFSRNKRVLVNISYVAASFLGLALLVLNKVPVSGARPEGPCSSYQPCP